VDALAEASAHGRPYQAVLLDWQMPDLDGLATAERIQALPLQPPPKMALVTAFGREEVFNQAQGAASATVLVKPINHSVLFDTLADLLAGSLLLGAPNEPSR
jgi:two-component system, sensor histidine kinase and response regulator